MDVNGIGANTVNLNQYNANLSDYAQNNTDVAVPQVKEIEGQYKEDNNGKSEEYNKKELDEAIKKLNNFLKDDKTHAEYSYYKELKTTMVKIVDEDTKEVILEIPSKKILDMVASMMRQVGLLDKRA